MQGEICCCGTNFAQYVGRSTLETVHRVDQVGPLLQLLKTATSLNILPAYGHAPNMDSLASILSEEDDIELDLPLLRPPFFQ